MVYFCFLSCLLFFSLMQFPLLFAAFWSQNCCILELTSPICMPTWLLAFGFGFTWLLACIGFLFPTFLCGVLVFFWCTPVRRLPPPTARKPPHTTLSHTTLCLTQLFHRHTTMALGDSMGFYSDLYKTLTQHFCVAGVAHFVTSIFRWLFFRWLWWLGQKSISHDGSILTVLLY